jgi:hypothetical protein
VTLKLEGAPALEVGQDVHMKLPGEGLHLFDATGRALR